MSLLSSLLLLVRPRARVRVYDGGVSFEWTGSDEHRYASPLAPELERLDDERRRRVVTLRVLPGGKT